MDYQFGTLDLSDDSDAGRARRAGWIQAVQFGFHEGRTSDEFTKLWLEFALADRATCVGAWLPDSAFGAGDVPVATAGWFDKTFPST